jgi:8-oxo-dGTP pyrophosphatase MutT (NUDIX family)
MGLFPRWSKEKLTEEELYIKNERASERLEEKENNVKSHRRNRDEEVIDDYECLVKETLEEANYSVDLEEINTIADGIPDKHRVLKYKYDD